MRVLKGKYLQGMEGTQVLRKCHNSSFTWKGVVAQTPLVKRNIGWNFSNGSDTLFWTDKWLGESDLLLAASEVPNIEALDRKVAGYWCLEGWKLEEFQCHDLLVCCSKLRLKEFSLNPLKMTLSHGNQALEETFQLTQLVGAYGLNHHG